MFIVLLLASTLMAQESGIFKDLKSYYEACGVIGKDDPKFETCNPPNMNQIMANFQKDPKNVEAMKKISRFHMTHSLQGQGKMSLAALYSALSEEKKIKKIYPTDLAPFKEAWKYNSKFAISFSPSCRPASKTSLDLGQKLDVSVEEMKVIKETINSLSSYPCPDSKNKFSLFAVGVVDPTGKPDVWMINENKKLTQLRSSTGRTPFE